MSNKNYSAKNLGPKSSILSKKRFGSKHYSNKDGITGGGTLGFDVTLKNALISELLLRISEILEISEILGISEILEISEILYLDT